ncbi:MAG: hypothetical protein ACUVRC_09085 [Desulfotomaculales bacterium]
MPVREPTAVAGVRRPHIPYLDGDKFAVVARLVEHFRKDYDVIDVDGARVLFGDGWGLVRASNTQPVLVARCEARTPEGPHLPGYAWGFTGRRRSRFRVGVLASPCAADDADYRRDL